MNVRWTPEALAQCTPSSHSDLVNAELPTAAVAWNELKKWISSIAATVTGGVDPRLAVQVASVWGGDVAPTQESVILTASAWRLLGQRGGERQFANYVTRTFGLAHAVECFAHGPPTVVGLNDRHFGSPATAFGDDAWRAIRTVWLAASESERAAVLPRVKSLTSVNYMADDVKFALEMMTEARELRPAQLDWAGVQQVHALRFDLLLRYGADVGPLIIEALGVAREHGIGVEQQRSFVEALALIDSPELAKHMEAERQMPSTQDIAQAYFAPRAAVPSSNEVIDAGAMTSQRRWSIDEFKALLSQPIVRRLVWAAYDEDGFVLDSFRVHSDGSLKTGREEDFELEDGSVVGVVRREDLDAITLKQWAKVFADHELTQPFEQL